MENRRRQAGAELYQAQNQLGRTSLAMLGYDGLLPFSFFLLFRWGWVGVGGGWVGGELKNKANSATTSVEFELGLSLAI